MLTQFGVSEIPGALMSGWATPDDSQMPEGVEALAKVIGEPLAARASWQRRLVVLPDKTWRLLVNECGFLSSGELPQFSPGSVTPVPVAVEIGIAAELLKQPTNCETVLAQRQQFIAELNRRHAQQEEDERARQLATAKRQLDAAESAKVFRHSDWASLDVWQQGFYSLALRVQDRDPELAADLKAVAGASRGVYGERSSPLPPPREQWWL
jgi:hypothetical protein